jgi:hypothetical protein
MQPTEAEIRIEQQWFHDWLRERLTNTFIDFSNSLVDAVKPARRSIPS